MKGEGIKVVFIPCSIKYDIMTPLRKTLGNQILVIDMIGNLYISDYSSDKNMDELKIKIKDSIINTLDSLVFDNCQFYLLSNGGALHVALAAEELLKNNMKFKYLVFESKLGKYIEIENI